MQDTAKFIFQAILGLIAFGCVLFLAFVTTRFIARKSDINMRGKYLSIIESISLGMDKKLCIVKAGEKYVLIAVYAKKVDFLLEIDIDDVEMISDKEDDDRVFNFKSLFEKYITVHKAGQENHSNKVENRSEKSIFKSNINKIKLLTMKKDAHGQKDKDES